jgi:predicted DNA-binding transcriptional regulator YafY
VKPYEFEKRLRRLLVLIPAARAAGPRGLEVEKALAITGARSLAELQDDVAAVDEVAVGTDADADHLLLEVSQGRVRVDVDMGFGRPPPLSLGEGAALLSTLRPFLRKAGRPGDRSGPQAGRAVEKAAARIRKAVPDHLRAEVERLAATTDLALPPPSEWADTLEEGIARHVEVTLEYRAAADGAFSRKAVEPRALFPREGHWYLVAWSVAGKAEHLYRLDRIQSAVLGERHFEEHRGPSLDRLGGRRAYLASGEERRITLRFAPAAAHQAAERWPGQSRLQPDGSALVTFEATPNEFLLGQLLGWGGQAEVVSPPELRARLLDRVVALQTRYAGAP